MFVIYGYNEDGESERIATCRSYADAIASAGSHMDSGAWARVTVEIETSTADGCAYTTVYTA
jgi:hypothetical protein